ncbi:L,D-transpeptidase family protein [Sphingomonas sabuli]|uniref:L,D-transpeptidase family protein n=1 Tax=Sphingomonas sabuli TaxID=2764186 RepID=A0A7G9L3E7_9SPHN|nr:L,D-transpeptidase family protein [Sphingomonas sabuli]QNM83146.1 L,D-transpeptidase family protein [Sphingomonas sabuli]
MTKRALLCAAVAALAAFPTTTGVALAQNAPTAYQSAGFPTAGQVSAFYASSRLGPIWFQGNALKPAATDLIAVMQRAPLDGIAAGPQYAAQLQQAVQAAATGSPQAIAFADRSLSEAFVLYVQSMERPITGMTYGYEYLRPKVSSADKILAIAAGVPNLQQHVEQIANPNSIYAGIRNTAWSQMQASGVTTPDPRVVANLERVRGMPSKGRFVMVNSANQTLYMYNDNVPVGSMKIVVGDNGEHLKNRPDTRTPLITSTMHYVIHNPYWNASDVLLRLNIAPRYAAEGDSYLKARGFRVMSDWTHDAKELPASSVDWAGVRAGKVSVRIRQDPGPDNFMGELKFPFANPQDIYLHDTDPADRKLFSLAQRTRSNGCVRLENAHGLATWLLGHAPDPSIKQAEYPEQMARGVPVFVTYITAQPDNGKLTFLKDVYGWDPAGGARASGK